MPAAILLYNSALTAQQTLTERLASQSDARSDAQSVLSSKRAEVRILLNIGKTHSLLNQTAEALEICQQALNLARESNDKLAENNAVKMIDEIKRRK